MINEFSIFETMRYKEGKIFVLTSHLQRLLKSAKYFDFNTQHFINLFKPFLVNINNTSRYRINIEIKSFYIHNYTPLWEFIKNSKLIDILQNEYSLDSDSDSIIRLSLFQNGTLKFDIMPYEEITSKKIMISQTIVSSKDIFLYHKTTQREHYKDSIDIIRNNNLFDLLYFNENNALCEGSRSNVVIYKNKSYYTPPVEQGLLRGTLLSIFLESKCCEERMIYKDDLIDADMIFCINSVRGVIRVIIE